MSEEFYIRDNQIETYNQFEPKSIDLVIDRTPNVNYFCTSASIPGISSGAARVETPHATIKLHGDSTTYQPLIVNFIVDEKLQNFKEIVQWMDSYMHPITYDQYKDDVPQNQLHQSKYSDITLLLTNNKYNITHKFLFRDAFPVDITDIIVDIQTQKTTNTVATVTFEYTYYQYID